MKPNTPLDPIAYVGQIAELATARGFRVEHFGDAANCPLIALTKSQTNARPSIYLSAGIHGDEPAPPWALADLIEAGCFDSRANWYLCPLLNPAGFQKRTRENAEGLDLNRDYRLARSREIIAHVRWLEKQPAFDLALCLHEDWEAKGLYLYELNPADLTSLAEPIIQAVAKKHEIDLGEIIDGRPAQGGIIRPDHDPTIRDQWPEAIYLRANHTKLTYTIETASMFPLNQRVSAQRIAVETAISAFLG